MNTKSLILASVLILLPIAASATSGAEGAATTGMERLEQELALSDDQKAKLQTIFKAQQEKLRAIQEESNARIKEVLNPEQLAKWEAAKQQLLERQREIIRQRQSQKQ